jgi:hypothetical protein
MGSHLCKASLALATFLTAALCAATPGVAQGAWTTGAVFPTTHVRGLGAWFPANGRFYVLGGRTSDLAGSDLLSPSEYTPGLNAWTVKSAVFPSNEVNNMVGGVLTDGGTPYIYCVGGSAAGAATSTPAVRRYDPVADAITIVASDPWPTTANTLGGGGVVLNNKLYVFGGFTIGVGMTSEIWQFDPAGAAGSRWTLKAATLPVAMGYVPTAEVGGLIYLCGGSTFSAGALLDSSNSYVYDPVADTIAPIAAIPRATGETRAFNQGGSVWVLGGGRIAPNPSNEVDAYAPGPNTWSLGPAFVTARRNIAAAIDPATGNIYMVGGYAPGTATDNMEIFSVCSSPTTYCTAKLNSIGCTPAIGSLGAASATATSGFVVSGSNVRNQKSGLLFYGVSGQNGLPFQGGTLCVKSPIKRTPGTTSGGSPLPASDCTGVYSIDMNSFSHGNLGGTPLAALTVVGTVVDCQWWGRDPGFPAPDNTTLTNGLEYTVCP